MNSLLEAELSNPSLFSFSFSFSFSFPFFFSFFFPSFLSLEPALAGLVNSDIWCDGNISTLLVVWIDRA